MTAIVNPTIFKFLTDLKNNNTREWFAENKEYKNGWIYDCCHVYSVVD